MAAEREDPAQKVSTPGEAEAAATQSRPASDAAPPLPASPGVQTAEDSTTGAATAASAVDSAAGDPATCVCTPGEEALRSEREATRGRSGRGRSTESCGFTRLSGSIFSSSSLGSSGLGGGDNGASACADSQRPFKDRARRQKTPCGLPRPLFLSLLAVYTLLTGKVFSGWPSLSNLLLREGAFEWLCDDEAAAPAPGVSEARCEAQLLAVNKLFAICLATSFSFSFVAGEARRHRTLDTAFASLRWKAPLTERKECSERERACCLLVAAARFSARSGGAEGDCLGGKFHFSFRMDTSRVL